MRTATLERPAPALSPEPALKPGPPAAEPAAGRPADPLEVRVLTSLEALEAIRPFWSAWQRHPNADLDFFSLIVTLRPEVVRPCVLVVLRGGEPVALVAGRVEDGRLEIKAGYKVLCRPKVRRITLLYGGCMGEDSEEVNTAVVRCLVRTLRDQQADLLSWSGLRWGSPRQRLVATLPGFFCRDYLARPVQHWTMNLPASLEEFLEKKMNKKHRYWAKRTMKVLEKDFPGGVRHACFARPEEVDKLFTDTVAVAKKTYQWGLGVGFQDNDENRRRFRQAAEQGWLRGYILYLKDEPMAFWICTVYQDTVHLDFTGYDPGYRKYEVGTALFLRLVGELGSQGRQHLDFGLGSAAYKERFGDASFEETIMCVFRGSPRGLLLNALRLATQGPSDLLRNVLLRLRLEQKVKRLWRRLATPSQEKKEPATSKPEAGD